VAKNNGLGSRIGGRGKQPGDPFYEQWRHDGEFRGVCRENRQPGYDSRRTLTGWLIATTVALTAATALALACLVRHL
jgi:hypothetical protein